MKHFIRIFLICAILALITGGLTLTLLIILSFIFDISTNYQYKAAILSSIVAVLYYLYQLIKS